MYFKVSKLNSNILKIVKLSNPRHGVGYDNVDLDFIKNNISLLSTAANASAVAEHVIMMMLSISKSVFNFDNELEKKFQKKFKKFKLRLLNKNILIADLKDREVFNQKCLAVKVNVYDPFVDEKTVNSFGEIKLTTL